MYRFWRESSTKAFTSLSAVECDRTGVRIHGQPCTTCIVTRRLCKRFKRESMSIRKNGSTIVEFEEPSWQAKEFPRYGKCHQDEWQCFIHHGKQDDERFSSDGRRVQTAFDTHGGYTENEQIQCDQYWLSAVLTAVFAEVILLNAMLDYLDLPAASILRAGRKIFEESARETTKKYGNQPAGALGRVPQQVFA